MGALKETLFLKTLLIVVLATAVLGAVMTSLVRERIQSSMQERATLTAVAIARQPIKTFLGHLEGAQPIAEPLFEEMDAFVRNHLLIHEVESIKLWNPQGTVVYSSLPAQIGEPFSGDRQLLRALHGDIAHGTQQEIGSMDEGGPGDLLEVYIPLSWESGVVAGAIGVSVPYGPYAAQINSATRYIISIAVVSTIALMAILYTLFRFTSPREYCPDTESGTPVEPFRSRIPGGFTGPQPRSHRRGVDGPARPRLQFTSGCTVRAAGLEVRVART